MNAVARSLLFAGAALAGYWLGSPGSHVAPDAAGIASEAPLPAATDAPVKATQRSADCEPQASEPASAEPARAPASTVAPPPPSQLPEKYQRLIAPRGPPPLTLAQRYSAFLEEGRDEAWASRTEAAIRLLVTNSGADTLQADYVACGRRRCIVAGYLDPNVADRACWVMQLAAGTRTFPEGADGSCLVHDDGGLRRYIEFLEVERGP